MLKSPIFQKLYKNHNSPCKWGKNVYSYAYRSKLRLFVPNNLV